jgi:hypothetical protein
MVPLILLCAWTGATCDAAAQEPMSVQKHTGRQCKALAPPNWSFTGENPAGSAFGADMQCADGKVIASYFTIVLVRASKMPTSTTTPGFHSS